MSVRVLFHREVSSQRRHELVVHEAELLIGRRDPARPDIVPHIELTLDNTVSRMHARVWSNDGRWWIEDLGSRHGTKVGDKQIQGAGAVELPYGIPVVTGRTTWLIEPEDRWITWFDSLLVSLDLASMVNFAAYHSGVPLARDCRVVNCGTEATPPLTLCLEIPGYAVPCKFELPAVPSMQNVSARVPAISLDSTALRAQIEPTKTVWRVELEMSVHGAAAVRSDSAEGTRRIFSAQKDLTILGYWDWSFEPAARKTIAVFSTPRNPAIERAIQEAQRTAAVEWEGAKSFRELLRTGRADVEVRTLRALYEHLANAWSIHYEDPQASGERSHTFQTIRSAHRILSANSERAGSATCIDLALIFAACLENIGLCPVVLFMGEQDQEPRHAVVGVWSGTTPGPYPVCDEREFVLREVGARRLHLVECTGVATSAVGSGARLQFEQAQRAAEDALRKVRWVSLVDIMNVRPPAGRVVPLENPFEPEVAALFDKARLIAVAMNARNVEMVHLLFAVLLTNAGTAARVVDRMRVNRHAVQELVELQGPQTEGTAYPAPTANLVECRQLAHSFARQEESPSVREQDLLWALLQKAPHSMRLVEMCVKLHFDLEQFRQNLAELHPSPTLDSTGTYTSIFVNQS